MKFVKFTLIGIIGITFAFLSLGLFHPTIQYKNQVEINAAIEKSYIIFMTDSLRSEWLIGYVGYEILTGTPNTAGFRYLITFENEGETYQMIEEVKNIKENENYIFDMETDLFTGTVEIYFEGDEENTTIKVYSSLSGSNLFYRSMFYLMKSVFQKQSHMNYELLKKVVENYK